jgi:hypothetical protein
MLDPSGMIGLDDVTGAVDDVGDRAEDVGGAADSAWDSTAGAREWAENAAEDAVGAASSEIQAFDDSVLDPIGNAASDAGDGSGTAASTSQVVWPSPALDSAQPPPLERAASGSQPHGRK